MPRGDPGGGRAARFAETVVEAHRDRGVVGHLPDRSRLGVGRACCVVRPRVEHRAPQVPSSSTQRTSSLRASSMLEVGILATPIKPLRVVRAELGKPVVVRTRARQPKPAIVDLLDGVPQVRVAVEDLGGDAVGVLRLDALAPGRTAPASPRRRRRRPSSRVAASMRYPEPVAVDATNGTGLDALDEPRAPTVPRLELRRPVPQASRQPRSRTGPPARPRASPPRSARTPGSLGHRLLFLS